MKHHLVNNIATLITRAQRQQFLVHSDVWCVLTLMKAIVIRYIEEKKGGALRRKGRSGGRGTTLLFRCQTNVMTSNNSLYHSTVRSDPYPYPYNISLAVSYLSSRYRVMVMNVSIQLHSSISAWICECVIFCVDVQTRSLVKRALCILPSKSCSHLVFHNLYPSPPLPPYTLSASPYPNLLAHHHACRVSSSRITPISPSAINRLLTPASSLHRWAGWMPPVAVDGSTVLHLASSLL